MFCPNCGKELSDDVAFCLQCGAKLSENSVVNDADSVAAPTYSEATQSFSENTAQNAQYAAENASEQSNNQVNQSSSPKIDFGDIKAKAAKLPELLKNKKIMTIGIAAAAAIVVIIILACVCSSIAKSASEIKGGYYLSSDGSEYSVYYNGSKVSGTDLSDFALLVAVSDDGTKALMADYGDSTLYYLSKGQVSKVTDDYNEYYYALSSDGTTVAYADADAIYIYKNGKSSKAADINESLYSGPVISPNGDVIAYSEKDSSDRIRTYAVKNGKVIDLDAKITPIAVSNGGSVLYGINDNNKLCYISNLKLNSAETIKEVEYYYYGNEFSSDNKKVLFYSDGSTYYFDTSLSDPIKVYSGMLTMIYPEGGIMALDDFKSFLAYSDGKIIQFTRKGKEYDKETVASYAYEYMLSADGKTLLYVKNSSLYKTKVSNPDGKVEIAEDVYYFDADKNLKNVYYENYDYELRYAGGNRILDDVELFMVSESGVCLFTDEDDTLYYSVSGGEKKKAGVSDVDYIIERNGVIYVSSDDEIYVSTNGKTFKKQ